ncbi:tRNA lysidine(34) synthetase TilS [Cystobacter fuscus]
MGSGPPPPGALALSLREDTRWPLTVRTRRVGDRVRGPAGSRKLQDVLVDGRVPREHRDRVPVVTDAGGVCSGYQGCGIRRTRALYGCISGHCLLARASPGAVRYRSRTIRGACQKRNPQNS